MYVCVCVCVRVCMYVCMYLRTYACMHACVYVCMYVCIHTYMHTYIHARMHVRCQQSWEHERVSCATPTLCAVSCGTPKLCASCYGHVRSARTGTHVRYITKLSTTHVLQVVVAGLRPARVCTCVHARARGACVREHAVMRKMA